MLLRILKHKATQVKLAKVKPYKGRSFAPILFTNTTNTAIKAAAEIINMAPQLNRYLLTAN